MSRQLFLTISSIIATGVGIFALIFAENLLKSKGVQPITATLVWTREVGLLLVAMGIVLFSIRKHEDTKTLKAVLFGNIIIQIGLFLIELIAYLDGIITKQSGIVPNLCLHIVLALGFFYFWKKAMHSKV